MFLISVGRLAREAGASRLVQRVARRPVPDHVADHEGEPAVAERDRVEPVAARRLLAARDEMARRQPDAGKHG